MGEIGGGINNEIVKPMISFTKSPDGSVSFKINEQPKQGVDGNENDVTNNKEGQNLENKKQTRKVISFNRDPVTGEVSVKEKIIEIDDEPKKNEDVIKKLQPENLDNTDEKQLELKKTIDIQSIISGDKDNQNKSLVIEDEGIKKNEKSKEEALSDSQLMKATVIPGTGEVIFEPVDVQPTQLVEKIKIDPKTGEVIRELVDKKVIKAEMDLKMKERIEEEKKRKLQENEKTILNKIKNLLQSPIARKGITVAVTACLSLMIGSPLAQPKEDEVIRTGEQLRVVDIFNNASVAELETILGQDSKQIFDKIGHSFLQKENSYVEHTRPRTEGFEGTRFGNGKIEAIINTLPIGFMDNVDYIKISNEEKTFKNSSYGIKEGENIKFAGVASIALNGRSDIIIYPAGINSSTEWVVNSLITHEATHTNSWYGAGMSQQDKYRLFTLVSMRVRSDDRVKFSYVESIGSDPNSKTSKIDIIRYKTDEYLAQICETYFSANYSTLPQKDREIVELFIKRLDPNFNRESSYKARQSIIASIDQQTNK